VTVLRQLALRDGSSARETYGDVVVARGIDDELGSMGLRAGTVGGRPVFGGFGIVRKGGREFSGRGMESMGYMERGGGRGGGGSRRCASACLSGRSCEGGGEGCDEGKRRREEATDCVGRVDVEKVAVEIGEFFFGGMRIGPTWLRRQLLGLEAQIVVTVRGCTFSRNCCF